jgi:hypothetical protein
MIFQCDHWSEKVAEEKNVVNTLLKIIEHTDWRAL